MSQTRLPAVAALLLALVGSAAVADGPYDIQTFGAQPDGRTLCTEAIQKAVDRCSEAGRGTFRNVVVSSIVATDCFAIGCAAAGLFGHRIENVTLSNISLGFEGGGTRDDAVRETPEKPDGYLENTMFGTLLAHGFFYRHIEGLTLDNVRLQTATPDQRHAVVFDDVEIRP